MRDPNRNIDMLLAQTQDPIAKSQINAHFRVTTQKVTHDRDHIASAEQHGSAYRQISSQLRFARELAGNLAHQDIGLFAAPQPLAMVSV